MEPNAAPIVAFIDRQMVETLSTQMMFIDPP